MDHIKQMESSYSLEADEKKLCTEKKIPTVKFRQIKERILAESVREGKVVKMDLLKDYPLIDASIVEDIAEFLCNKELIRLCKEVHKPA